MERRIDWKPINDIIQGIREREVEGIASSIRFWKEQTIRDIERVESNRLACALLDGAGFNLDISSWERGISVELELGFFPRTRAGLALMAQTIRNVRVALGVKKLTQTGKKIADEKKKTILVKLGCDDFPGLTINYSIKEPKHGVNGVKCRIVKRRVTQTELVCERE